MTTDEAVYIIAHTEGINLAKYLDLATLDRVRAMIPREIKPLPVVPQARSISKKKSRPKSLPSYPLVSGTFIQRIVVIGDESFPQIVVLENSIRSLIEQTLSAINAAWWDSLVPDKIRTMFSEQLIKRKNIPIVKREVITQYFIAILPI